MMAQAGGSPTVGTRPGTDASDGTPGPDRPLVPDMGGGATGTNIREPRRKEDAVPSKSANVRNEKQYEALKNKGMSKQRAAKIANSPDASKHGGKKSGSGGDSSQGGTSAQKKKAGRKGGKAAAKKG
jgi:hypothetical protein